jgi:hypothetical protein
MSRGQWQVRNVGAATRSQRRLPRAKRLHRPNATCLARATLTLPAALATGFGSTRLVQQQLLLLLPLLLRLLPRRHLLDGPSWAVTRIRTRVL